MHSSSAQAAASLKPRRGMASVPLGASSLRQGTEQNALRGMQGRKRALQPAGEWLKPQRGQRGARRPRASAAPLPDEPATLGLA